MMGTGKTHMGKMLAETLDLQFHDSDHVIEERGGLSINEIFELYGEKRFRQAEEKTILELLGQGVSVIATGGGAPANPAILGAIKKQSISIYLESDVDAIYDRIKQAKNRPLLNNENPKAILENLLKDRADIYAQADITIQTHAKDADATLNKILHALHNKA